MFKFKGITFEAHVNNKFLWHGITFEVEEQKAIINGNAVFMFGGF